MALVKRIINEDRIGRWQISGAEFTLCICFIVASIFACSATLAKAYQYFYDIPLDPESVHFAIVAGYGLQIGALLGFALFRLVAEPPKSQPSSFPTGKAIGIGIGALALSYALLLPTVQLWTELLDLLKIDYEEQMAVSMVQRIETHFELAAMGVLIVVVAPVSEEVIYRRVLFRWLNGRLPSILPALVAGGLFALVHDNLFSFAPLFVLGTMLCLAYRYTGRIITSISIHCLFNLLNFLGILFLQRDSL